MDFVEEFSLQNPLLLLAPPSQTVDPVAQRAVALAVEHLDYPRRKPAIRLRPRDALVQIHEVALVDAGRGRVDDHEHLRGEVVAPPVENHTGHMNVLGFVGVRALIELQRGQPVLAVDDQKLLLRFLEVTRGVAFAQRLEAQFLRCE